MHIIYQKMIYREDLVNNRTALYLFGDNTEREGYGGQAAEMRDEPNAHGIATKKSPGMGKNDFFSDTPECLKIVMRDFELLQNRLKADGYTTLIIPADGLGTGLSRLPEKAPMLAEFIDHMLKKIVPRWVI